MSPISHLVHVQTPVLHYRDASSTLYLRLTDVTKWLKGLKWKLRFKYQCGKQQIAVLAQAGGFSLTGGSTCYSPLTKGAVGAQLDL